MRVLHTADWHLGRTLEGRSRIEEQAQFLDELAEIVESENIDAVLMAGDAFDTVNPPAAAEQLFYESISRLSDKGKRPVIVIAGNHDNPDRLAAAAPLADNQSIKLLGLPTMEVQNIWVPSSGETLQIAALAYPSESRLAEVLSESNDELSLRQKYDERIQGIFGQMESQFTSGAVHMAMSHIYVAGSSSSDSERPIEVGGAYTVAAESLPASAQYVALGHLHRPQNIKRAKTAARYSGSPLAYSFSEAGYAKSVSIIDAKPGSPASVSEILLSSGKPLVKWKATEGLAQVHAWLDEDKDKDAWVDLEIHLANALSLEEIHRLRKHHSGLIHIRPVFKDLYEENDKKELSSIPIDQLFERFYTKQTGGAVPEPELITLFLELVNEDNAEEGEEN